MKKTMRKYDYPSVGCYVDESAGSADGCNSRTIQFAAAYGFDVQEHGGMPDVDRDGEDAQQALSELADKAVDYLNGLEDRTAMSWGFEDNSLFLSADPESAKEQVDFVSSKQQEWPADDFRGEWLHVNDHGNCTLYCREDEKATCGVTPSIGRDREIWSLV